MQIKKIDNSCLIQGDCIEAMRMLIEQGVKVDAVITDIPYFKIVPFKWDNIWSNENDYIKWVSDCVKLNNELLKENSSLLLFTSRQYNRKICNVMDNYFDEKRIIIWARKRAFNNTRGKALASGYEPICFYTKGNPAFNNIKLKLETNRKEYNEGILKDGVSLSDVWVDIPALPHNSKEKVPHPSQKPIKLMERCVKMVTNEGDLVLDFTMGSGTTGVACRNLNRKFIGIELDENYYQIACDRIQKETGKEEKCVLSR